MSRFHIMKWRVAEEHLSTVMGVVTEAKVAEYIGSDLEQVTQTPAPPPPKPKRTHHYQGGIRNKGVTGRELLLQLLTSEKRSFSTVEIDTAFKAKEFSLNSVGPIINSALRDKKIKKVKPGHYALA